MLWINGLTAHNFTWDAGTHQLILAISPPQIDNYARKIMNDTRVDISIKAPEGLLHFKKFKWFSMIKRDGKLIVEGTYG